MKTFQFICNIIVLLGGVVGAVSAIAALIGKPIILFKKRKMTQQDKDRKALITNVSETILIQLSPKFEALTKTIDTLTQVQVEHNAQLEQLKAEMESQRKALQEQKETLDVMVLTTKDLLRDAILNIYNNNKRRRALTETERELVDELYRDYRAEHGNSYIEKKYKRMEHWELIPDEDEQQPLSPSP